MSKINVDKDIRIAETLPRNFYKSIEIFEDVKEKIFVKSWQLVGHENILPVNINIFPFSFLPNFLDEPLILVREKDDTIKCLSNVCTHRANIIISDPCEKKSLSCHYHGRKFDLDGKFKFMPDFEKTKNFPRDCDNLKSFPISYLGPFYFTSLEPSYAIQNIFDEISARLTFFNFRGLIPRSDLSVDHLVNANWAIYCENYLDPFHIPFVHKELTNVLDINQYKTEIYDKYNLQIGYSSDGKDCFEIPKGHQDYGSKISAYYYWIFPNIMLNFYPWGLSINVVTPININRTKISFIQFMIDESKYNSGAGGLIDKVEREDEFVVEQVSKGLESRYYNTGRFSATKEEAIHHFHRLVADYLR
tara:strand:+ start:186 stop:1268 length:1083 start_codon:yes stop_codon:yes gene_type:complete